MSSLTLNMVGGGGGGLSATDALLRVQAPAQSTVTITKGSVTKTDAGHENEDDNNYYDYYFIIHSSQFDSNPWTVTATDGTHTKTGTIVINAADEYDLLLEYKLWLYNLGDVNSSLAGSWRGGQTNWSQTSYPTGNPTVEFEPIGRIYFSLGTTGQRQACLVRDRVIDMSAYTTLVMDLQIETNAASGQIALVASGNVTAGQQLASTNASKVTTRQTVTADVSSVSSAYPCVFVYSNNANATFRLYRMWLE